MTGPNDRILPPGGLGPKLAPITQPCQRCSGTGWLRFRCGTPWRCECNRSTSKPWLMEDFE